MKQLSSFMVLDVGGGKRISYTYDEIDDNTGEPISRNNKGNFYAVNADLRSDIESIQTFIYENKLSD